MDRQSPGEKQPDANKTAAVTMGTGAACTQAPPASLSAVPPDRQAVQVIQHSIHRPQSMAAQYLHQMYAAQQQHLMLRTAALQQHQHPAHLQSLATIQQASVCQRQTPASSSLVQPAVVGSQSSIALPASPVTAQLISRTQTSTAASTTISQQAMLLGNRPANCNQAQMYLRTQMLILTPAATVAAVQSSLPAVTSCSSTPSPSQVQNLALHAHLPGALATAHGVILKPSAQSQALSPGASLSKTSVCALKTNQLTDASTDAAPPDAPRLSCRPQIIGPAAYSPVQPHALVKQQLSCPVGQQVAHHQLIVQQAAGGGGSNPSHRQLHPITLRVAPQDGGSSPLPLSVKRLTGSSSDPPASSAHAVQPQPPPLVAAPQRRTSFPQLQNHPPPPPPPLVLPRLPHHPPAALHRLSLQSVQALAVQSGQVLLTERELPVAEALVQMPYQNLPPPQTVAVDLKVHPVRRGEAGRLQAEHKCKENGLSSEEGRGSAGPQRERSPSSLTAAAKHNGAVACSSFHRSQSPQEESSQLTPSSADPSNPPPPPPPPPPLPPPILPVAVRGPSQPPSDPSSLPGSPDRTLSSHVLTHLVEGFIIREGLEPFPVGPSSLLADQQASLPESQEGQTNGDVAEDSPLDADQSDSSESEMENEAPAADVADLGENAGDVLQCEYCGNTGYSDTFLRSRRFCSMTCGRRYSVSCSKRVAVQRSARWAQRPMGRRGRPPGKVNGASREHFLRQTRPSFHSEENRSTSSRRDPEDEQEAEEPPVPMTTRLRRQTEREREREPEQDVPETITVSDGEDGGCPSGWDVEQVFSYISALPGGSDVAAEFRSQEIDGQALLLLTEEHLVSTMNLKLGPALKLCAHINALRDT
ncbi:polyhomeotic-like protein 3 [Salarias fasciatus]|uniref:polyhomeotic-like protein 3 n=1 Tax=Salarias fasciatus TaxID=181472 RepID=UPI001176643E|nr:polyhomeotic-like protein 3 [Salarias fasciatus]